MKNGSADPAQQGRIIDISNSGVFFEAARSVCPGTRIEICIAWPMLAGASPRLELHITGRTVRSEDNRTGVEILQSEFVTCAVN